MKYLDTKENSIEDSVTRVLMGEKLVGGQKKLDKDKDGDIDGKDFAMLRKAAAKKKDKNEMKLGMPGMSSFDPTLRKRKKDVKEGTWAMPDSPKLKMGLKKALQRPIMLGKEGDDATDTIRSFIGDDELYDDLYAAGMKNPKGDARPINDQESRAFALASLGFVDAIVIFEEETPEELIKALTPNILVKGSDYLENEIVGGT